jgi:hypothetical protein
MIRLVMIYRLSRQPFTASGTRVRARPSRYSRTFALSHFRTFALLFGRAPPLRSGSGCARTRARYNCAQVRRAPSASGQRYCCCPAAPGSRPCGRASLTQPQRHPSDGPVRGPHPPGQCLSRHDRRSAPQFSPSPRGTSGEGAGGRGPRGRSAMPVAEPHTVPHANPSPEVGGGVGRRREERAKRRPGERARVAQRRAPPGQKPYRPPIHLPPAIDHRPLGTCDSALGTRHSALGTRHSALGTRHSALRTPHSALGTPHSALRTPHSALRTPHFRTPHFRTSALRTSALPHFRTSALPHFRTSALPHFRTFALSHFRTASAQHTRRANLASNGAAGRAASPLRAPGTVDSAGAPPAQRPGHAHHPSNPAADTRSYSWASGED